MFLGSTTFWIIFLSTLLGGLAGFLLHGFLFGFRLKPDLPAQPAGPVGPPLMDPRLQAQSETAQAIHHEAMGNLPLARDHFLKALGLFESVNDIEGVLHACELLASLHASLNDADGVQTYWRYALALATSAGRREEKARLLSRLGFMAVDRGDWTEAEQLLGEVLRLEEDLGDAHGVAGLASTLGTLEEQKGHFALAIEYWDQALRLAPKGSILADLCGEALGRLNRGREEIFHKTAPGD